MEGNINTENRLTKMEQKIDNLIDDVKDISKDIKALDSKYSGKWVEKLTLAIAGGLVIGIIMLLIEKI